jgi:hypothetical protein
MYVRFTTVPPSDLPRNLSVASTHLDGEAVWMLDENELLTPDPTLLETLTAVGTHAALMLPALPRATPLTPWGELRIEIDDIEIRDISWTLTESGYVIRVPRLFTPRMQAQIMALGSEQMRWFDPPAPR